MCAHSGGAPSGVKLIHCRRPAIPTTAASLPKRPSHHPTAILSPRLSEPPKRMRVLGPVPADGIDDGSASEVCWRLPARAGELGAPSGGAASASPRTIII